jgi:hypothetical protein
MSVRRGAQNTRVKPHKGHALDRRRPCVPSRRLTRQARRPWPPAGALSATRVARAPTTWSIARTTHPSQGAGAREPLGGIIAGARPRETIVPEAMELLSNPCGLAWRLDHESCGAGPAGRGRQGRRSAPAVRVGPWSRTRCVRDRGRRGGASEPRSLRRLVPGRGSEASVVRCMHQCLEMYPA